MERELQKRGSRETIWEALLSKEDAFHSLMDQSFGCYDVDGLQVQIKRNKIG